MLFIITKILLHLTQGFALFFAIKFWDRYKNGDQRFFLHFMIYVVISEIIAFCLGYFTTVNNTFIYNIYVLICFVFYFYWFLKVQPAKKSMIKIIMIIFIVSYIYAVFQRQFFSSIMMVPFLVGTLSILILVSFLFTDMLKSEDVTEFKNSQKFWFATALLIFNIGFLPILFFQSVLDSHSSYHGLIMMILNVLLYGCFIIGFSVKIKK